MIALLNSDARHIPLVDRSVQCVVTSPPYWGLRDYGTGTWQGGDPECDHSPSNTTAQRGIKTSTLGGGRIQLRISKRAIRQPAHAAARSGSIIRSA